MRKWSISNTKLTWETSKKFDVGFDLSFINRIHLSLDYYNETTSDALMKMPLSMTTGLYSTYKNIGKIRNQGIETTLTYDIVSNHDWKWKSGINFTFNANKIVKTYTDDRGNPAKTSRSTNCMPLSWRK